MAYHERPRESLPTVRVAPPSRPSVDYAKLRRLEQARNRLSVDVRHSPADSSPWIRALLGYDEPPRPPQRFERRITWRADGTFGPTDVHVGPVDPTSEPPRRRMRPA